MKIKFEDFKQKLQRYKNIVKEDNEEDFEETPKRVGTVEGGEFLVDIEFPEYNTSLKNFRVVAIHKEDALSRLNNFFGKGSFKVTKIELEGVEHPPKTDKMLGMVKESLEESKGECKSSKKDLEEILNKKSGRKIVGFIKDPSYIATDRRNKTSVESETQIQEVSQETLKSYIKKSEEDMKRQNDEAVKKYDVYTHLKPSEYSKREPLSKEMNQHTKIYFKREKGSKMAKQKLNN